MKKWLTSLILVLALAAGVLAGTPRHSGNMDGAMMECCDKAKSGEQTPESNLARLCCAFNCSDSAPTSPVISFNLSPSAVIVRESFNNRIAAFLIVKGKPASTVKAAPEQAPLPKEFPPKYIQHHSFLI
jgi:hypothetical protein